MIQVNGIDNLGATDPLPVITFSDIVVPWYEQWWGMAAIGGALLVGWKVFLTKNEDK